NVFTKKKTQFKAKKFFIHRLHIDNIAFHPSSTFTTCLWNCDFLWLTPDLPSGVSIFFCPEISSLNSTEIERDRSLALVDKVKVTDIEKLTKENFPCPETVMDRLAYPKLPCNCFTMFWPNIPFGQIPK
ncbi:MAG: hypothetical protein ACK53Y_08690, partial [bacterium]